MTFKLLFMPGDGIGPEVVAEAAKVIDCLRKGSALDVETSTASIGGAAYEECGNPLPDESLELARGADAIILGAVGGPQWEKLPRSSRPEAALLKLRSELELFSNLRPAFTFPQLADASSLKPGLVAGLDILIIRELTGGIYFGQPRGVEPTAAGGRRGFNTMEYTENEIVRIAHTAFRAAGLRNNRVCSVDKANVLECSELWREVTNRVAQDYPGIELSHMYVDNAAMQLVRLPKQFDVIVTSNLFGDILSDVAAMLTGSIGMLPSASLNAAEKGMYEPVHGSAPDIAGSQTANPLATILSVAMALRYTLKQPQMASRIEDAVSAVLDLGIRTADIATPSSSLVTTSQMGDAVVEALDSL